MEAEEDGPRDVPSPETRRTCLVSLLLGVAFSCLFMPFNILFGLFFGHFEGGEKKHVFRDGSLVLRSYEDFMENAIGGVVTRASRDLVAWALEAPISWREQQTLELGAGCGLVSSALMHLGAAVVATDLLELVPHLEYNLSLNATGLGWRVRALNWDSKSDRLALRAELGPPDAIFAANCATAPHVGASAKAFTAVTPWRSSWPPCRRGVRCPHGAFRGALGPGDAGAHVRRAAATCRSRASPGHSISVT